MRENAEMASGRIAVWREWDLSLCEAAVDLDWRKGARVSLDSSPYGFVLPESWARMENERVLEEALFSMYVMLLAGDAAFLEQYVGEMEECLSPRRGERRSRNLYGGIPSISSTFLSLG